MEEMNLFQNFCCDKKLIKPDIFKNVCMFILQLTKTSYNRGKYQQ